MTRGKSFFFRRFLDVLKTRTVKDPKLTSLGENPSKKKGER